MKTPLRLPDGMEVYRRTPDFTEETLPAGLLADHTTKPGVWARIVVMEGRLRYAVASLGHDEVLSPGKPGVVLPEVPHHITPVGEVRFFVEFLRKPG